MPAVTRLNFWLFPASNTSQPACAMPDDTSTAAAPENFRTAYCRRFKCPTKAFERRLFWRCLPLRAWPFAIVFRVFYPSFFNADLEFLHGIGGCKTPSEAVNEANSLSCDPALNEGILRTPLGLRLSGRRLVRTAHQIWPPLARPTWTPAASTGTDAPRFVAPIPKAPQTPKPTRPAPQPESKPTSIAPSRAPAPALNQGSQENSLFGGQAGPPRKRSPYNPAGSRNRKR